MPGGSKYKGLPKTLEAYQSVVEGSQSGAEVKGAKNPYTSRNGHMFSFLVAEGTMALRNRRDSPGFSDLRVMRPFWQSGDTRPSGLKAIDTVGFDLASSRGVSFCFVLSRGPHTDQKASIVGRSYWL
jgi:hypothetical protein